MDDIMSTISEDLKLAVKRGATWMDQNHPGWVGRIDLSNLDMNNCHNCIIGQAVGNYFDKIYEIEDVPESEADEWAIEYGFNVEIDDNDWVEYRQLEKLWTDEVKKRLG